MAHANVIRRASGIYGYRRVVPEELRALVGPVPGFDHKVPRTEFVISLATTDKREAIRLAALHDGNVEAAFRSARVALLAAKAGETAAPTTHHVRITPEQAVSALARWRDAELARVELNAFNGLATPDSDPRGYSSPLLVEIMRDFVQGGTFWREVADCYNFDALLTSALNSAGLRVTLTHPALPHLRRPYATAWSEVCSFYRSVTTIGLRMPDLPGRRDVGDNVAPQSSSLADVPPARRRSSATPILEHEALWAVSLGRSGQNLRGVASYVSDLRQFASDNPSLTVETITKRAVREWSVTLHTANVKVVTIRRKLSALRNYWKYLQTEEYVDEGNDPFSGITLPRINALEEAKNARKRYSPAAVSALWRLAEAEGKQDLADVIKIGAYTGARIASIIALKISSVWVDGETGVRVVHFDDKTANGVRNVPIHSVVAPLFDQLIKDAKDGLLFPKGGVNKYNRPSNVYSMGFGRLKTKAGFNQQYCFHSVRHTFAMLVKVGGREESMTAEIMGHAHAGISHGRYGRDTPLNVLAEIVEKSLIYPDGPVTLPETTSP